MANIFEYLRKIQLAARGEEVRDAIIGSLNVMNTDIPIVVEDRLREAKRRGDFNGPQGKDGPNKITAATATDLNGLLRGNGSKVEVQTLDTAPVKDSTNPVTSGGVAAALENFQPAGMADWEQCDPAQPDYIKNRPFFANPEFKESFHYEYGSVDPNYPLTCYFDLDGVRYWSAHSELTMGQAAFLPGNQLCRITINGKRYHGHCEKMTLSLTNSSSGTTREDSGDALLIPGVGCLVQKRSDETASWDRCRSSFKYYSVDRSAAKYDVTVENKTRETITKLPSKYLDLPPSAPAFHKNDRPADMANITQDSYMSGFRMEYSDILVASAYNDKYYTIKLNQLGNYVIKSCWNNSIETSARTVSGAINELCGQLTTMQQQITKQAEQQKTALEKQSEQITRLRRQVAALQAIVDPDGVQTEVDADGNLIVTGSGVEVEDGVLTINSGRVSVEDGFITM